MAIMDQVEQLFSSSELLFFNYWRSLPFSMPSSLGPLRLCLVLCALAQFSLQVDVMIGGKRWVFSDEYGNIEVWSAGCENLQPGECCMKPPGLAINPGFVVFTGLQDLDIAFLWKARLLSPPDTFPVQATHGCSGDSFRSQMGGPSWTYRWGSAWANDNPADEAVRNPNAAGANYLRLPPRLPPTEKEVDWLGMEGMKGFVWDSGKWFKDQVQYAPMFVGSGGSKRSLKRDSTILPGPQISKNKSMFKGGTFYASQTQKGRYVDWITINGTNFTDGGRGNLKYTNVAGLTLDLNSTTT